MGILLDPPDDDYDYDESLQSTYEAHRNKGLSRKISLALVFLQHYRKEKKEVEVGDEEEVHYQRESESQELENSAPSETTQEQPPPLVNNVGGKYGKGRRETVPKGPNRKHAVTGERVDYAEGMGKEAGGDGFTLNSGDQEQYEEFRGKGLSRQACLLLVGLEKRELGEEKELGVLISSFHNIPGYSSPSSSKGSFKNEPAAPYAYDDNTANLHPAGVKFEDTHPFGFDGARDTPPPPGTPDIKPEGTAGFFGWGLEDPETVTAKDMMREWEWFKKSATDTDTDADSAADTAAVVKKGEEEDEVEKEEKRVEEDEVDYGTDSGTEMDTLEQPQEPDTADPGMLEGSAGTAELEAVDRVAPVVIPTPEAEAMDTNLMIPEELQHVEKADETENVASPTLTEQGEAPVNLPGEPAAASPVETDTTVEPAVSDVKELTAQQQFESAAEPTIGEHVPAASKDGDQDSDAMDTDADEETTFIAPRDEPASVTQKEEQAALIPSSDPYSPPPPPPPPPAASPPPLIDADSDRNDSKRPQTDEYYGYSTTENIQQENPTRAHNSLPAKPGRSYSLSPQPQDEYSHRNDTGHRGHRNDYNHHGVPKGPRGHPQDGNEENTARYDNSNRGGRGAYRGGTYVGKPVKYDHSGHGGGRYGDNARSAEYHQQRGNGSYRGGYRGGRGGRGGYYNNRNNTTQIGGVNVPQHRRVTHNYRPSDAPLPLSMAPYYREQQQHFGNYPQQYNQRAYPEQQYDQHDQYANPSYGGHNRQRFSGRSASYGEYNSQQQHATASPPPPQQGYPGPNYYPQQQPTYRGQPNYNQHYPHAQSRNSYNYIPPPPAAQTFVPSPPQMKSIKSEYASPQPPPPPPRLNLSEQPVFRERREKGKPPDRDRDIPTGTTKTSSEGGYRAVSGSVRFKLPKRVGSGSKVNIHAGEGERKRDDACRGVKEGKFQLDLGVGNDRQGRERETSVVVGGDQERGGEGRGDDQGEEDKHPQDIEQSDDGNGISPKIISPENNAASNAQRFANWDAMERILDGENTADDYSFTLSPSDPKPSAGEPALLTANESLENEADNENAPHASEPLSPSNEVTEPEPETPEPEEENAILSSHGENLLHVYRSPQRPSKNVHASAGSVKDGRGRYYVSFEEMETELAIFVNKENGNGVVEQRQPKTPTKNSKEKAKKRGFTTRRGRSGGKLSKLKLPGGLNVGGFLAEEGVSTPSVTSFDGGGGGGGGGDTTPTPITFGADVGMEDHGDVTAIVLPDNEDGDNMPALEGEEVFDFENCFERIIRGKGLLKSLKRQNGGGEETETEDEVDLVPNPPPRKLSVDNGKDEEHENGKEDEEGGEGREEEEEDTLSSMKAKAIALGFAEPTTEEFVPMPLGEEHEASMVAPPHGLQPEQHTPGGISTVMTPADSVDGDVPFSNLQLSTCPSTPKLRDEDKGAYTSELNGQNEGKHDPTPITPLKSSVNVTPMKRRSESPAKRSVNGTSPKKRKQAGGISTTATGVKKELKGLINLKTRSGSASPTKRETIRRRTSSRKSGNVHEWWKVGSKSGEKPSNYSEREISRLARGRKSSG